MRQSWLSTILPTPLSAGQVLILITSDVLLLPAFCSWLPFRYHPGRIIRSCPASCFAFSASTLLSLPSPSSSSVPSVYLRCTSSFGLPSSLVLLLRYQNIIHHLHTFPARLYSAFPDVLPQSGILKNSYSRVPAEDASYVLRSWPST